MDRLKFCNKGMEDRTRKRSNALGGSVARDESLIKRAYS